MRLVKDDEFNRADLSAAVSVFWQLKFFMDGGYKRQAPNSMAWSYRSLAINGVKKVFQGPVKLCEARMPLDGSYLQTWKA